MSIENLGKKHITLEQSKEFDEALDKITTIVVSVTQNLSSEERIKFGSVNETNKLFVNSVLDFRNTQPNLSTTDVDWAEFNLDYADRAFADTRLNKLATPQRMLSDFKIVHDYDNYRNALVDYDFASYKSGTNTPGFAEKHKKLKQFFPNSGAGGTTPKKEG
jgi:hypothetical protein